MKIELTDKEIQRIGSGRYLTPSRSNIVSVILIVLCLLGVGSVFVIKDMGRIINDIVFVSFVLVGFLQFFYVAFYKAEKEGKKFLEQCKKEREI
jgi:hypothetical protein